MNCHNCGSITIEKTLMAPKLLKKNWKENVSIKNNKYKKINEKIREYQRFIKNNFKYVGNNFAYEARSIHYKSKKNTKGIYGTASKEEIKDLKDEGSETEIIPWIEDKNN